MVFRKFEDIDVWKKSRKVVYEIYTITSSDSLKKDFGLKDQIQRASVSIMSNIAEGFDSGSTKSFIRYLYISMGSASELQSLFYVLVDQKMIDNSKFEQIYNDVCEVKKMLFGLIATLSRKISKD